MLGANALRANERDVLERAGLRPLMHARLNRLSEGQRRRVALARLVLAAKPLWLLDEPTEAVDDAGALWFAACIDDHLREGGALVATTHRPLAVDAARARHLHLERSAA